MLLILQHIDKKSIVSVEPGGIPMGSSLETTDRITQSTEALLSIRLTSSRNKGFRRIE
jgi:hypothetical protein